MRNTESNRDTYAAISDIHARRGFKLFFKEKYIILIKLINTVETFTFRIPFIELDFVLTKFSLTGPIHLLF